MARQLRPCQGEDWSFPDTLRRVENAALEVEIGPRRDPRLAAEFSLRGGGGSCERWREPPQLLPAACHCHSSPCQRTTPGNNGLGGL